MNTWTTRSNEVDRADALLDRDLVRWLPRGERAVLRQNLRGEEAEAIARIVIDAAQALREMPAIYTNEELGDEALVRAHYFGGSYDAWLTEREAGELSDEGSTLCFGLVRLDPSYDPELGYIEVAELTANGIELDLYWHPKTVREIRERLDRRAAR